MGAHMEVRKFKKKIFSYVVKFFRTGKFRTFRTQLQKIIKKIPTVKKLFLFSIRKVKGWNSRGRKKILRQLKIWTLFGGSKLANFALDRFWKILKKKIPGKVVSHRKFNFKGGLCSKIFRFSASKPDFQRFKGCAPKLFNIHGFHFS